WHPRIVMDCKAIVTDCEVKAGRRAYSSSHRCARRAPTRRRQTMAKAIRFHQPGSPDVMRLEAVEVGMPGPGQVRLRHQAIGLNFADTYFRNGTYPVALPSGIGVEAAGTVEEVGAGVANVQPGDAVAYTGFLNTLGAYSDVPLVSAAPLIKLP